jgi:CheY-like chemotaxis protein
VQGLAGQGATVLVTDDDVSFARGLALLLRSQFQVWTASDSRGALQGLGQRPPDVALLDLEMPADLAPSDEEEGLYLARALRRRLGKGFPVVLITRHDLPTLPPEYAAEVDEIFHKPVDVEALTASIVHLLSLHRAVGHPEVPLRIVAGGG